LCDFANRVTRALYEERAEALEPSEDLDFAQRCFRSAYQHLWTIAFRVATGAAEKKTAVEEIHELLVTRVQGPAEKPRIDRRPLRHGGSVPRGRGEV
jgi:hypothetical protein